MIISISYIMLFSFILVGFCATSDARVSYNKRLFRKFVGFYVLAGAQVSYNKRLFHEFVGTVENYSNRKSHKRNRTFQFVGFLKIDAYLKPIKVINNSVLWEI